jgi:hypothetical protein
MKQNDFTERVLDNVLTGLTFFFGSLFIIAVVSLL